MPNILIVDDEPTNCLLLETILLEEGHSVSCAENGREAVKLFEQQRPDLILMDIMMPEMDGYEATRLIKALAGEQFVPVIFLTGITDEYQLARCVECGGDDFLTKPYSKVTLNAKIESLSRQQAMIIKLQDTQAQLLQAEKMASIGQLAAGMAHEINTPLGFITSNLGSLQSYQQDLLSLVDVYLKADPVLSQQSDLWQDIQTARAQADLDFLREDVTALINESMDGLMRIKGIVQNLKDYSAVDQLEWQLIDLNKSLVNTLELIHGDSAKNVKIVEEYGELPDVECHSAQINQLFTNLLTNAFQTMDGKGVVTLRTYQQDDNRVSIEIVDSGKGITEEHLKHIFDPFFTTRSVGSGMGLGLSVAYSIVKQHQGQIEAQSEVGKGTTMKILLPRRQTAQV